MDKKQKRKSAFQEGQSMVEYLILVAIIIIVVMALLAPGGYFQKAFNWTIYKQGEDMYKPASRMFR